MQRAAEHLGAHCDSGLGSRDSGLGKIGGKAAIIPGSRTPNRENRILVIRLSSIGDIVHTLPAVSALGESFPDSEITWLVERRYASVIEGNPYIHSIVEIDTLGWRERLASTETAREVFQCLRRIRSQVFDAVIDFQGLVKTGLIARLCRARMRLGFARPWLKERAAAVFYNCHVSAEGRKHAIEEALALVERLGVKGGPWRFPLAYWPQDEEYVDRALARIHVKDFILINPGGGWHAKLWPPRCYSELIRRLDSEGFPKVVLSGSAVEEGQIQSIIRNSGSSRACYLPTTIRQFLALARRSRLFIGGDTGPLHLAAALNVPIVALYGPTDPARNGPVSPADIVLSTRQPVNHTRRIKKPSYIEGISVDDTVRAVRDRLAKANERSV
jgi:heptosyltransferase I